MNERRYYYRGMYGICATMVCLLLALASAMFARSSFIKRRELLERASG